MFKNNFIQKFLIFLTLTASHLAIAQVGGFDSKVNSLTNMILTKIFPPVAILGLIYAAILAATGDEGSKRRMVLVVIAVIVGFLAKFVIPMLQGAM